MPKDKPITISDENGEEIILPMKWAICETCSGNGRHSLAIDGHGITQEERDRDWDDESWADYLQGKYDKTCNDCSGTGKVKIVDEDRLTTKEQALWSAWQQEEYEYRKMCEMERRMGA